MFPDILPIYSYILSCLASLLGADLATWYLLPGTTIILVQSFQMTHAVAPLTSSPLMWPSVLLQRYICQLDVNGRFNYYLNHLAHLCAALRRSRVAQCHQGVVGGVPKPSYSLLL